MPPRKQPRRIAREVALLSLSQLRGNPDKLEKETLNNLVLAAIRMLRAEVEETLETASAEVQRGSDRLLGSELRATDVKSAKTMISDALELTKTAINRLGTAVELPQMIQMAENRQEVRDYAIELIATVYRRREEIDKLLQEVMVNWQLSRLAKIDRDILRLAVAEMWFLNIQDKYAINEAVELAKNYSDEEGYRFINGVLRKVTEQLKTQVTR